MNKTCVCRPAFDAMHVLVVCTVGYRRRAITAAGFAGGEVSDVAGNRCSLSWRCALGVLLTTTYRGATWAVVISLYNAFTGLGRRIRGFCCCRIRP